MINIEYLNDKDIILIGEGVCNQKKKPDSLRIVLYGRNVKDNLLF